MPLRRKLILAPLALACAPAWPQASAPVTLAGVRFEPGASVGGGALLLNGAGIRYKAIFKVYAAGLYLSARAASLEAAVAAPGPKRVHIVMLRDIDANELGKLFTQGMEKNASKDVFMKSIPGTLKLAELFARKKKLASGDAFSVDWVPGQGTTVVINGKPELEPIPEPAFFQALLGIWLGKDPADGPLKRALLGQESPAAPPS
ncbi:chalcone isomerase family protein [Ideonella livida]|uniref:Chalcone isomerase domain-containing protein n=1 Tax=Ideonella livida TaxID=2707176 RepID=A0A7C9PG62_9BURK|nr:chalcone isomerase family protein [Ideonella livida]NDY91076.1 hypothetical protein [Ideonella livida]